MNPFIVFFRHSATVPLEIEPVSAASSLPPASVTRSMTSFWTFSDRTNRSKYEQFFDLGVDGLFSDNPDTAVEARG